MADMYTPLSSSLVNQVLQNKAAANRTILSKESSLTPNFVKDSAWQAALENTSKVPGSTAGGHVKADQVSQKTFAEARAISLYSEAAFQAKESMENMPSKVPLNQNVPGKIGTINSNTQSLTPSREAAAWKAAKAMEDEFVNTLLQGLFAGIDSQDGESKSSYRTMMRSIMTQSIAENMKGPGFGIAESIMKDLRRREGMQS